VAKMPDSLTIKLKLDSSEFIFRKNEVDERLKKTGKEEDENVTNRFVQLRIIAVEIGDIE
jgi:hypothetical protein